MEKTKPSRLVSLDALRGFDMLWIIGGEHVIRNWAKATNWGVANFLSKQTDHMVWEGFHAYDLIMPLFLFMVGMSIPFSLHKRLTSGSSKTSIYIHTIKRAAILFILGMVCQGHLLDFELDHLILISDTLQTIAVGYLFSTIIYTQLKLRWQLMLTLFLIFGYWAIMQFMAVPGYEAGVFTHQINPGKYIDNIVLGRFVDPNADYTYILSFAGFIATVMSGVFASTIIRSENISIRFIQSSNKMVHKAAMLALVGLTLVIAGQIMNIWFPIIKRLWTASFILFTSGLSFSLIALFYYLIDVKGYQRWAFWLKVIGMNSIAVYMAGYLFNFQKIGPVVLYGLEKWLGVYYPMVNSIFCLAVVYSVLYWMYKKNTFIKI